MTADYEQALHNAARDMVKLYGRGNALARADYHLGVYRHERPEVREEWRRLWGDALHDAVRASMASDVRLGQLTTNVAVPELRRAG